jgi:isoquinoline 1-oxidoreductase beta subunit
VNPLTVEMQTESSVVYALTAALYGEITIKEGRVEQSNFHDYQPLRINEMPNIDVHILHSTEAPTGVGEPGVPPIGPAVANAWRALTGQSVRHLPFARTLAV